MPGTSRHPRCGPTAVGLDGQPAWHGPALLDKLPGPGPEPGQTRLRLHTLPEGGVHVDVGRKMMGEWHTVDNMGICRELSSRWPGWQTESWGDRYEEQASRCGRALRLPELDLAAGADSGRAWIRKRVYQGFADSPAGASRHARSLDR